MHRRHLLLAATALVAVPRLEAYAQGSGGGQGDPIRPLVLITRPQAAAPAAYQAAELVGEPLCDREPQPKSLAGASLAIARLKELFEQARLVVL